MYIRVTTGREYRITDAHVTNFMQESCIAAHRDRQHYLWLRITRLTSHPLLITATMLRNTPSINFEAIQFRLHWYSNASKRTLATAHELCGGYLPKPFLQTRIPLLTSHSLRVTAAVLLTNAGIQLEDIIQFHLRWYSDAVKEHIRDCPRTMRWLSEKAFDRAFPDRFASAAAA